MRLFSKTKSSPQMYKPDTFGSVFTPQSYYQQPIYSSSLSQPCAPSYAAPCSDSNMQFGQTQYQPPLNQSIYPSTSASQPGFSMNQPDFSSNQLAYPYYLNKQPRYPTSSQPIYTPKKFVSSRKQQQQRRDNDDDDDDDDNDDDHDDDDDDDDDEDDCPTQQDLIDELEDNPDLEDLIDQIVGRIPPELCGVHPPQHREEVLRVKSKCPPRTVTIRRRLPSPEPDTVDRVVIIQPPQDRVNIVIEKPRMPDTCYNDRTETDDAPDIIVHSQVVCVSPESQPCSSYNKHSKQFGKKKNMFFSNQAIYSQPPCQPYQQKSWSKKQIFPMINQQQMYSASQPQLQTVPLYQQKSWPKKQSFKQQSYADCQQPIYKTPPCQPQPQMQTVPFYQQKSWQKKQTFPLMNQQTFSASQPIYNYTPPCHPQTIPSYQSWSKKLTFPVMDQQQQQLYSYPKYVNSAFSSSQNQKYASSCGTFDLGSVMLPHCLSVNKKFSIQEQRVDPFSSSEQQAQQTPTSISSQIPCPTTIASKNKSKKSKKSKKLQKLSCVNVFSQQQQPPSKKITNYTYNWPQTAQPSSSFNVSNLQNELNDLSSIQQKKKSKKQTCISQEQSPQGC